MKISKRTSVVAVATAAATIAAGGLAFAFWSTNGTGSASATAGTAAGVTAVASPSNSGTLYPSVSVPAVINISNPNSFPVKVSRVLVVASSTPTVTGGSGCTAGNSTVTLGAGDTGALVGAAQIPIAANGTATVTVGSIAMGIASDNGCQSATFSFAGASAASPSPITVTAAAG